MASQTRLYFARPCIESPVGIKICIKDHIEALCAEFQSYFIDPPQYVSWHNNPFDIEVDPLTEEAEELSELSFECGKGSI